MKIKEIQIWNEVASQILIRVTSVELNTSCSIFYELQSNEGKHLISGNLVIEGEDYTNWGNDDSYLTDIILQKLNLEKE